MDVTIQPTRGARSATTLERARAMRAIFAWGKAGSRSTASRSIILKGSRGRLESLRHDDSLTVALLLKDPKWPSWLKDHLAGSRPTNGNVTKSETDVRLAFIEALALALAEGE